MDPACYIRPSGEGFVSLCCSECGELSQWRMIGTREGLHRSAAHLLVVHGSGLGAAETMSQLRTEEALL